MRQGNSRIRPTRAARGQSPRRRLRCSPVTGMTASWQPNGHRGPGPTPAVGDPGPAAGLQVQVRSAGRSQYRICLPRHVWTSGNLLGRGSGDPDSTSLYRALESTGRALRPHRLPPSRNAKRSRGRHLMGWKRSTSTGMRRLLRSPRTFARGSARWWRSICSRPQCTVCCSAGTFSPPSRTWTPFATNRSYGRWARRR